jgi:hypothetical protein
MFKPPITNVNLQRTIRPLYAHHQATPWAGFIDPDYMENKTVDVYPGSVMYRVSGEVFAPVTDPTTQKPFGLAALFVAPGLGVDEVTPTNTNLFSVWVGGNDSLFEILAPAFDATADWTLATDGSRQLLTANAEGLLTPAGATAANAAAELIEVVGPNKIIVRLVTPTA